MQAQLSFSHEEGKYLEGATSLEGVMQCRLITYEENIMVPALFNLFENTLK